MVELLADGFVLEFLGIQLIYWCVLVERRVDREETGVGIKRSAEMKHPVQQQDRSQ